MRAASNPAIASRFTPAAKLKASLLIWPLLFLSLVACQPSNPEGSSANDRRTLPGSNGGTLDLIVVAPDTLYAGLGGEMLRKHFTSMQYGLPQPEPRFTVRQVEPKDYNELLKRTRYQILLTTGPESIKFVEEQHAKDQLLIYLSAPNQKQLARLVNRHQEEMREQLKTLERKRLRQRFRPALRDAGAISDVYAKHQVKLVLPKDYELDIEKEDFLLYWKKTNLSDFGIMVHFRPLPQGDMILGNRIIPIRDSLTQRYVKGAREGSYMVVEDLIAPKIKTLSIEDQFAMEARGLWRTEGDIMGGPFVSYTIFDEKHQQIIYLDAFIYGPQEKKRNNLFEMEALLRSVEIL